MIINKQQKWNDNVFLLCQEICKKTYQNHVIWCKCNVKILRLWYQTMVDEISKV